MKPGYRTSLTQVPTNTSVTVATSTTQILAANTFRNGLVIVNDGANVVYLGFGVAAVAGSGVRLNASGGSIQLDSNSLIPHVVNGIAVGGSSNVTVLEF